MNPRLSTLSLILALLGPVAAEVPRKPVLSKYQDLWKDSPFTAKPVGTAAPAYNPLQDYVLLGVSPIQEGYRVTMINRKRPNDERIIVESHRPAEGFQIKEVTHREGEPLATTVRLQRGSSSGTIAFEEKFLTLKPPPAAPQPANGQRGNPRTTATPNPGQAPEPPRPPRRRIVQPGTTVERPGIPAQQGQPTQDVRRILNLPTGAGGTPGNSGR